MAWSVLLLGLLAYGADFQIVVTQEPSLSVSPGGTVTLTCGLSSGSVTTSNYPDWYQQTQAGLLACLSTTQTTRPSGVPNHFSGSISGNKATLTITGAQPEDEAYYYSAVYQGSGSTKGFPLKHLTKYTSIPDQSSSERRDRGNIPQHLESHLRKAHSKYHSQWGNPRSLSPKVRNETEMTTLTTVIQHSTRSLSLSNQTTKRNKRHSNWQRRSQTLPLHR
uniref:Ig-like domain-containing protein n=1 Tax=Canis lupus dingo TaxID=286419 RepID=A0A8C0JGA5_CANLU